MLTLPRIEHDHERRSRVGLALTLIAATCVLASLHLPVRRMEESRAGAARVDTQKTQETKIHAHLFAAEYLFNTAPATD